MNIPQAPLPNYDKPPVGEVALSVQFEPLGAFQIAHLGLFWARIRDRFPTTQTQPPLEHVVETFDPPSRPVRPVIQLQVVNEPMPLRAWFLSATGNELIQVQRDRFVFNWRRLKPNDVYPRYERYIRQRFLSELQLFADFLKDEQLGELKVNQCEITYINQIASGEVWTSHGEIGKVLALWRRDLPDLNLPPCESVRLALQYLIANPVNPTTSPIGRVHVDVQPGVLLDEKRTPILAMNLTARGVPLGKGLEDIIGFMDLGRRYIVISFTALTTEEMHKEWGYHG